MHFGSRVRAYLRQMYRECADEIAAAGLPVVLQFGETQYWYFDTGLKALQDGAAFGADTKAGTGLLPNTGAIKWRKADDSGDLGMALSASNHLAMDAIIDWASGQTFGSLTVPDAMTLSKGVVQIDVLVALGLPKLVGARHTQTGRFWIEESRTEIFVVTLDKSEKAFSPSTRYEDYALSHTCFHWQSQSTTGEDSLTGQRYVRQRENGARFLLFVRPKKSDSFLFLGSLRYVSHSGSRSMSIYWDLYHPMPAWFFEVCSTASQLRTHTRFGMRSILKPTRRQSRRRL
jgi:hypothetical protein